MPEHNRDLETWLPVVGWERYYAVSDRGRVRSHDRVVTHPGHPGCREPMTRRIAGQVLNPVPDFQGRLIVSFSADGRRITSRVHVVVLEAFVGPRPEGLEGCHNDGDHTNNVPSNLRWDTSSSNSYDSVRHGTHPESKKLVCPREHRLVAPNLVPSQLRRGYRSCLACARAHSNHLPVDSVEFKVVADSYYAEITS